MVVLVVEPPTTFPITIVLPFVDKNALLFPIPPLPVAPPLRFPVIVIVPDDVFDIQVMSPVPPDCSALKLKPIGLKLQAPLCKINTSLPAALGVTSPPKLNVTVPVVAVI